MRQRMTDRWIEAAEARKVCEWTIAEQPSVCPAPVPLMTKLCSLVMLEAAHLHLALAPSTRPAA